MLQPIGSPGVHTNTREHTYTRNHTAHDTEIECPHHTEYLQVSTDSPLLVGMFR